MKNRLSNKLMSDTMLGAMVTAMVMITTSQSASPIAVSIFFLIMVCFCIKMFIDVKMLSDFEQCAGNDTLSSNVTAVRLETVRVNLAECNIKVITVKRHKVGSTISFVQGKLANYEVI